MTKIIAKIILVLNAVACGACIALAAKLVVMPVVAEHMYKDRYKDLMFECDDSMREHMIAKNRFRLAPSDENNAELRAAEVGLVACHEYDKMRKDMIIWGVSEAQLARYGLEAIEEKSKDVTELVRSHEFRY